MSVVLVLLVSLSAALGFPNSSTQRIVGGSVTTIDQYPQSASVLTSDDFLLYRHNCGSTILNNVAVLTAAHCHGDLNPQRYRIRVGSSFASSGGVVHAAQQIINHPSYSETGFDHDIAIIRTATSITYTNLVQPGFIAGGAYNVADNQPVWAIGWGLTESHTPSEQLRHVQIYTVNQATCRHRYGWILTDNMMCSGVLDVGGRDACTYDSGGPLLHKNVVVGVCSFGMQCGDPYYPGVHARVSRYTDWIIANAQ